MRKTIQVLSFLALSFLFGNVEAGAQTFAQRIDANIEFDFVIGDEVLPAGKYTLRVAGGATQPAVLQVRNEAREIVYQGLIRRNGERLRDSSALRFDRSSGRPVLISIMSEDFGYSVYAPSVDRFVAKNNKE